MSYDKTKSPPAIDHVRDLLEQGHPQDALKFIEHLGQKNPPTENARGVCLMRLGKVEQAVSVLRDVAFQGYVCMPSDTPVPYQINFAAAALLANLKDAAMPILNKLDAEEHPEVAQLKNAVRQWFQNLNFFQKCCCKVGIYPRKAVKIDFVPGMI